MKTIDLSKCKKGDKLKCRNGTIMIFDRVYTSKDNTIYPYRLTDCTGFYRYTENGVYNIHTETGFDIIGYVENTFDFSTLPDDCDMISIGGIVYKKVTKWEAH